MRETPVLGDPIVAAGSTRAGGPPRYVAMLTPATGPWFIGTGGRGIARSTDDGRTWTPVGRSLDRSDVNALVRVDDAVLAAAGTAGVLRSADDGVTWESIGPVGIDAFSVAMVGDELIVGASDGVYGADGRVERGPSSAVYRLLAVLPSRVVLAATAHDGLWRRDGDGSWAPAGLGEWPILALCDVGGGEVVAGTRGGGVHHSVDGGRTWSPLDWPFDPVVHVIVRGPAGDVLAGTGRGVLRRTESGTWEQFGDDLASRRIFSLSVAADGSVLAGSHEGVWRRAEEDDRWMSVDTGLAATEVFAVAPLGRGIAYGGLVGGVLRTADGGHTWQPAFAGVEDVTVLGFCRVGERGLVAATDDGLRRLDMASGRWLPAGLEGIAVHRMFVVEPDVVLVGTLGRGVLRQVEGGAWEPVDIGPGHPTVHDFVRATGTGAVYAATGTLAGAATAGGISRSTDRGATWTALDLEPINVYRIARSAHGVLFAGAQRGCLLRSADNGATWSVSRPAGCDDSTTYCLVVDRDDRIYLGTGPRLLYSDDFGDSWREVGRGLEGVTVYAVVVQVDASMLAATSSGIFRSADRGVSWRART